MHLWKRFHNRAHRRRSAELGNVVVWSIAILFASDVFYADFVLFRSLHLLMSSFCKILNTKSIASNLTVFSRSRCSANKIICSFLIESVYDVSNSRIFPSYAIITTFSVHLMSSTRKNRDWQKQEVDASGVPRTSFPTPLSSLSPQRCPTSEYTVSSPPWAWTLLTTVRLLDSCLAVNLEEWANVPKRAKKHPFSTSAKGNKRKL